jgi:magnesium-transporting ATPase (P-type)
MSERGPAVGKSDNPLTLVIDGQSLKHALSHDLKMDFLELCMSCKSVICCRVSPMQKAEVCIALQLYSILLLYLILK